MEPQKLLVNDKIGASSQRNMSPKHDIIYQTLQITKMNFEKLLG